MKNSVALLIAARAELAVHDDHDVIVSNLCRTFDIGTDDAQGAVVAAQLLASQPGRDDRIHPVEETPRRNRSVTYQQPCIATPHP
jgi:hypothetical protein